jgi:phosphatidylinositol glycan class M
LLLHTLVNIALVLILLSVTSHVGLEFKRRELQLVQKDYSSQLKELLLAHPNNKPTMVTKYSKWQIFTDAVALRIAFIVLGVLLDKFSSGLQYTDIDYHIFSDAAGYVSAGFSPYERSTYRYPPIVALLLVPNQWIPSFGKLIFSIADAACCLELCRCQSFLGYENHYRYVWLWAINIASINICTRGSADSLTNYLVILLVRLLLTSQWQKRSESVLSGAVLGALIYLRIYPVIYAPAVVVYLLAMGSKDSPRSTAQNVITTAVFLQSAFAVLVLLSSASYYFYGQSYWVNAVTYHMSREDHRHNFSLHFLGVYLSKGGDSTYASKVAEAVVHAVVQVVQMTPSMIAPSSATLTWLVAALTAMLPSVVLFLPQLVLFALIVLRFAPGNLPVCLLLQTMVFVAYNKVITAQYFTWYMCLLPLAMPSLCYIPKHVAAIAGVVWGAATGYWLYTAYLLEFAGQDNFVPVWVASLVFHWASAALIGVIVYYAPIAMPETFVAERD